MIAERTYTTFVGERLVAHGTLEKILPEVKDRFDKDEGTVFLIFEDETGRAYDFDLRGPLEEVINRSLPVRGPGRPKLGVISREISLLPRQWEWLERQPNGASAALRRLVDEARKREPAEQQARSAREAVGRILTAVAGDRPGYEEATRALYAGNRVRFELEIANWPVDIKAYLTQRLSELFP
jgi:hypothetical protein